MSTDVREGSAELAGAGDVGAVWNLQPTSLLAVAEPPKRRTRVRKLGFDIAEGVPVTGFTGVNGAGKTTLAIESAIADMKRGREVYSTVAIASPYGDSHPVLSLRQLVELRGVTVLLDDIAVIFSSNHGGALPGEVVVFLQTLRHRDIKLLWTAPAWMRAHNLVRSVTQGLVNVVPLVRHRVAGTPWPSPYFIAAGLLDTGSGKEDSTPTRVLRRRLYRPSRLLAWGCYDTKADTPLLGHAAHSGRCVDCGGAVTVPKHSQERHAQLGLPWYADDLTAKAIDARRDTGPRAGVAFRDSDGQLVGPSDEAARVLD